MIRTATQIKNAIANAQRTIKASSNTEHAKQEAATNIIPYAK
jgi:hypothetical protein